MGTNHDLSVRRGQSRRSVDHARRVIHEVVRGAPEPVLFSCVRLCGRRAPVVAQANLDLAGRTLRVRVEAPTQTAAVNLLAEQLRCRLDSND